MLRALVIAVILGVAVAAPSSPSAPKDSYPPVAIMHGVCCVCSCTASMREAQREGKSGAERRGEMKRGREW